MYPSSNSERDPVRIIKKYCNLLPDGKCKKFYLRPCKNTLPSVWYCDAPYGINKVRTAVKEMCRQAGIVGKFSNHSLRATCATRMYENSVPEQVIKETTGHRSDCVRTYKRTSDNLKKTASATVSGNNVSDVDVEKEINVDEPDEVPVKRQKKEVQDSKPFEMSMTKMMENVIKTRLELRKKLCPKSRLSLRKYRGHKVTIDFNVNVKK